MLNNFEFLSILFNLFINNINQTLKVMLASIHTIADSILLRKSLKWKNIGSTENINFDCIAIYDHMDQLIKECLSHILQKKNNIKDVCNYLFNLIGIKESLDNYAWTIPCNLTSEEYNIFLHDLDFYLLLSGSLINARNLLKGYIPGHKTPSCIRLLPQFNSNPRKVKQTISLLEDTPWRRKVDNYYLRNNYLKVLNDIVKINEYIPSEHILYLPLKNLIVAFNSLPATTEHENVLLSNICDIYQLIKRIYDNSKEPDLWNEYRQLITEVMLLGYGSKSIYDLYFQLFQQYKNTSISAIQSEIIFIKKQLKRVKQFNRDMNIKSNNNHIQLSNILIQLKESNCHKANIQYLEWNHNPKDFVKKLHQMIAKGYITLKGNNDLKPIIEIFNQFIKVKKQNNSGNLSYDSLLTYFKKANTGEL